MAIMGEDQKIHFSNKVNGDPIYAGDINEIKDKHNQIVDGVVQLEQDVSILPYVPKVYMQIGKIPHPTHGGIGDSTTIDSTSMIQVLGNLSDINVNKSVFRWYYWDENKAYIGWSPSVDLTKVNAKYVILCFDKSKNIDYSDLVIMQKKSLATNEDVLNTTSSVDVVLESSQLNQVASLIKDSTYINLLSKKIIKNAYINSTGDITATTYNYNTHIIDVSAIIGVAVRALAKTGAGDLVVKDASGAIIYRKPITGTEVSFVIPANANILMFANDYDTVGLPYIRCVNPYYGVGAKTNSLKTWESIGDSITWYDTNPRPDLGLTFGYQSVVKRSINFSGYRNPAASGTTILNWGGVTHFGSIGVADIYTIALGVNDWGKLSPLGTMNDYINNNGSDYSTIYAAYRRIINRCREKNKDCYIILMTPRRANKFFESSTGKNFLPDTSLLPNSIGVTLKQIADAIIEIANYEGLPVVDLYYKSGCNDSNLRSLSIDDSLHPNDKGMEVIGQMVTDVIKRFVI